MRLGHHGLELGLLGDVGLEGDRRSLVLADDVDGLLGRGEIVIDAQALGAFAREGEGRRAAVAHAFAGALARADDDGDLVLEAHVTRLPGSDTVGGPLYSTARCPSSWSPAPAPRRNRRRW